MTIEESRVYNKAKDFYPRSEMSDVNSFRHELRNAFVKGAQWQKEKTKKEVEIIIDGLVKNCPTFDAFGTEEECIVDAQIEALKLVIND